MVCVASSVVVYAVANFLGIRVNIIDKGNSIVFLMYGTLCYTFSRRHILNLFSIFISRKHV